MGVIRMFLVFKKERYYRRLFWAGIINGIGDRFSQVALLTLILQLTGSAMSVGITLSVRMIPFLLFGPLSSRLSMAFTRKKLLIGSDLLRAAIALSFLFVRSADDVWIIYTGSFLLASGEALYAPARKAGIPALVKKEHLKEINSWETVSLGFVLIIGALSGGIVSFLFGASAAFLVNVASFLIAAVIISGIPTLEHASPEETTAEGNAPNKFGIVALLMASPFVVMLFSGDLIFPFINGIENVLLSVYAVDTFKAADLGVGILYSVLGTGFIISPIITKRIKRGYLPLSFCCLFMEGIILSLISQMPSFYLVVILFGILTIFGGVGNTLLDTVIMETLPQKWHGDYFGFSVTAGNTLLGISMFLSGIVLDFISPRQLGLIGGLLYISAGLTFFIGSRFLDLAKEKQAMAEKAA